MARYIDTLSPVRREYWETALVVQKVIDEQDVVPTEHAPSEAIRVLARRQQAAINALLAEEGAEATLDFVNECARRLTD